jgi:FAD/FMN-containing dehydrogenase
MDVLERLRVACPDLVVHADAGERTGCLRRPAAVARLAPGAGRAPHRAARGGRAESTDAVAALVRWAAATRVALVPRGGGSGLMGGAAVLGPALVVDCRRLDAIVVDAEGVVVHAGAGAILARVDAALGGHGLMLGHDPWTVGVATVGGALGTNGLGYLGARAGSIGAQLRGLEAVLGDGTSLRAPAVPTHSTTPRPRASPRRQRGTLGIVTRGDARGAAAAGERIVAAWGRRSTRR